MKKINKNISRRNIYFKNRSSNWQKKKIIHAKKHQLIAKKSINNISISSREGKFFILPDGSKYIEFMCCSYLGLDQDLRLINSGKECLEKLGVNLAISRTRIRADQFDILENCLNKIFCNAYTTVFSSLHVLHLGMFPLIGSGEFPSYPIRSNGCCFIVDRFAHASLQLIKGIMNQFGEVTIINFQDHNALESEFKKAHKNHQTPITVSDSIISMGGIAPVLLLLELAEKYNGYVYLDDAHGTSIIGTHGCGYTLNLLKQEYHPRLILAASLSKGFGANGSVIVLPTEKDINLVRTFCVPYIFSNPPALAAVESAIASAKIHLSDEIKQLQSKLWANVKLFDELMQHKLENHMETSPVRRILVGSELNAIEHAEELKKKGFLLSPVMYPSVEKDKAILRVVLSAAHTEKQIHSLANNLLSIL